MIVELGVLIADVRSPVEVKSCTDDVTLTCGETCPTETPWSVIRILENQQPKLRLTPIFKDIELGKLIIGDCATGDRVSK